jgi:hypothetical protein
MAAKHEHVWLTRRDIDPETWDDPDGEFDNERSDFAYSAGYHNGPQCKLCGYHFCQHCKPGGYKTKCGATPEDGDDSKLFDPGMSQLLTIGAALGLIDSEAI